MSTNIAPKKKNPPYWLMLVAALMAVATANIITHWSDFEDGFRAGYSHAAGKQKG